MYCWPGSLKIVVVCGGILVLVSGISTGNMITTSCDLSSIIYSYVYQEWLPLLSYQSYNVYHNNSGVQKYNNSELLKQISIPPKAKVLDIGCGTGNLTTALSELVGPNGQVVAVDPDSQRIEFAKKENARPNIEYLVGDDQSFPGEDYDFIVSGNALTGLKTREDCLKLWRLRPLAVF